MNAVRPRNSEIAIGTKLGIDATKKLPGEGFKRPWPPLTKMDENVRKKISAFVRRKTVKTKSLVAPKRTRRRKMEAAVKNPNLRQSSQFRLLLLRWSSWESAEELKSLMKTLIRTPQDALWLLTVLLGESHSFGQEHRVRYSITLGFLERFTDIARLTNLLASLTSSKLAKRETIALREFNKALKRRADGQPDNVGDVMHDPDEEVLE